MDRQAVLDPMAAEVDRACREISANFDALRSLGPTIAAAAQLLIAAIRAGNKVLFCGNGGSAADCQHLAAELVGRYRRDRRALPAIALTVDSSALTAIGNDYGFQDLFARQLAALARPGDVLVALSTSGNSENIILAVEMARRLDVTTIGLTGHGGGAMAARCDLCIHVPATETARIQEMHIAVGHLLCGFVEDAIDAPEHRPGA
jgi:D-sedoheptulose 7-phosphate isomerase